MSTTNILIAVPAYGGSMKTQTVVSLLNLQKALRKKGVKIAYDFTAYAEITAVRNLMATRMVHTPEATHLLFIDSDMQFEPATVFRLLEAKKPVIGCFCSARTDEPSLCGAVDKPTPVPEDGLIEAGAVGMGVTLIERAALVEMAQSGQLAEQRQHPFTEQLSGPLLGFFTPPQQDVYLSEDIAFCRRYTQLTGKPIHALAREDIGHIGEKTYRRPTDISLIMPESVPD